MSAPAWAPSTDQVADYVTSRTVTQTVGAEQPSGTFSASTYPTDTQVNRLIASACDWVLLATGALDPTLTGSATDVAALRTAGMVELSYPDRTNDVTTAQALLAQADNALKALVAANLALTGKPPAMANTLLPVWQMPDDTSSVWQTYGDTNI
jgi:hypothetical protein